MTRRSAKQNSKEKGQQYKHNFVKDQFILVPVNEKDLNEVKLYKVLEDLKTNDDSVRLRALELVKIKDQQGSTTYEGLKPQFLGVNDKIKTITEVKIRTTHTKKPKSQFEFKNNEIQDVIKELQVQNQQTQKQRRKAPIIQKQPEKRQLKEEQQEVSDSEKSGTQSEGEEKIEKINTKVSKRLPAQKRTSKSTDSKNKIVKVEEQKQNTNKINAEKKNSGVLSNKYGRAVVKVDYKESQGTGDNNYESEGQEALEQEEQAEISQEVNVKQKKESKRQSVKKKVSGPAKYVKGKNNPLIDRIIDINRQLEDECDEMLPLQSIKLNNKELIRAAKTGNFRLLHNILDSEYKISSFFERWAPERDFNALELIFQNGDRKMLTKFLSAMKDKKQLKLTTLPECSLKEINTGFNDKYAYGVRTRQVAVSRGGREGNNALVYDITNEQDWSQYMFDRLLETQTDPHLFSILKANLDHTQNMNLEYRIPVAVRSGNYQVAGELIQALFKKGQVYGYNQVHVQVLTEKNSSVLAQIKRVSALKKNIGAMLITPVHCAAINPNPEFLSALLDISNELSIMDEIMRKPVHYAATCVGTGPLELLLKKGIDAREGDRDKNTPLILACKYGRVHNVQVLIASANLLEGDINKKNRDGNAAIHLAAQGGHLECIKELLKAGANISLNGKQKMTPLIMASAYGHLELVQYLVENGAKILTRDKMGRSALMMAVRNGNINVASYLLMHGADFNGIDSSKNTCVHYAAAYGFSECIELLIRAGANQNLKNSWNLTPLSVALQKNLFGVVKALLNYESTDVNCKDDEGRTLVSASLSKFNADTFEYIKFLILDKNADVTLTDLNDCSPLHYAAKIHPQNVSQFYPYWNITPISEKKEIIASYTQLILRLIELLLERGGNINHQDSSGHTPLLAALSCKNYEVAQHLIHLSEPDTTLIDKQDQNILHQMARDGIFMDQIGSEIFRQILQKIKNKSDFLIQLDSDGFTPYLRVVSQFAQSAKAQFANQQSKLIDEAFEDKLEALLLIENNQNPIIKKQTRKKQRVRSRQQKRIPKNKIIQQIDEDEDIDEDMVENDNENEDEQDQEDSQQNQFAYLNQPTKKNFCSVAQPFNLLQSNTQNQNPFVFNQAMPAKKQQVNQNLFSFGTVPNEQTGFASQRTFVINEKPKVIGITIQEYESIIHKALDLQKQLEQRFISILELLLENGANPRAQVAKIKKYRAPQYSTQIIEVESNLQQDEYSSNGLRGGARVQMTARAAVPSKSARVIQNQILQQNSLSNEQKYIEQGKQNSLHFIFMYYPCISVLEAILQLQKLDLDAQDFRGRTPLILFVKNCRETPLLNNKESPELHSIQFFKYVINTLKVNFHLADHHKNTPASILAVNAQFIMLEEICKLGATPNNLSKEDVVPILHWVKQNNIDNVRRLLQLSADPNFTDKSKRTSLHHAVNVSQSTADASFELEQLLIRHGAHADALDKNLRTPLFYAFIKIGNPFDKNEIDPFETVSSLCALPDCNVNLIDKWKKTPLHYAAQRGSVISGRYLIKLNGAVDNYDVDGNTPLAIAFINNHANMATMLIDNKANVSEIATIIDIKKLKEEIKLRKEAKDLLRDKKKLELLELKSKIIEERLDDDEDIDQDLDQDNDDHDGDGDDIYDYYSDDDNNQVKKPSIFGQPSYGGLFGVQQSKKQQQSELVPGQYSFFMLAIKNGWQGVAYLLISDGFDIQRAIEDAINADQFNLVKTLLMKVKDNEILHKVNKEGHNLFHIFAINGQKANDQASSAIIDELFYRKINEKALDKQNKSPLHYAAENNFIRLVSSLLERGCDPNQYDNTMNSPFSLGIQKQFNQFSQPQVLDLWLKAKVNLNLPFKVNSHVTTLIIYLIQEKNLLEEEIYKSLILNGVDINVRDDYDQGVIVHSIKANSIRLVNFFLDQPTLNKKLHERDIQGRNPIHYVIQPLEFGSYENIELLKLLSEIFDINQSDNDGKQPIDLANLQDSGIMRQELIKLGARDSNKFILQRQPTSVVQTADWPEEEVDFEIDSQLYLKQKEEEEKQKIQNLIEQGKYVEEQEDFSIKVDPNAATQGGQLSLVVDTELGPYTLLMTKVDVKNGYYSENVFYRMQVIHERNRNVYILFTRWGRIGTVGQWQLTPFDSQEGAVKEFCKIFSQKSGNDWRRVKSNEVSFEKHQGKYQLMNIQSQRNYKQLLEPFDYTNRSPYPPPKLDPTIQSLMIQITQVKLYVKQFEQLNIDQEFMPLERLCRNQLLRAREYLNEIQEFVRELSDLQKPGRNTWEPEELQELQRIKDDICERSSRFYELVPHRNFRQEPVPPIDNQNYLNQQYTVIETLLQFEITSKILLGAHLHKYKINPLTYSFNSLNIRVFNIPPEHPEFMLIKTYISRSHSIQKGFITNIFAIERKGETDRFQPWKSIGNRMLLWHGSKVSNYMGILSQGLKVAPPWAFNTGAMFGKGIYFADTFEKSYAYTEDYGLRFNSYNGLMNVTQERVNYEKEMKEINKYKYMLLCEVGLGGIKTLRQPEDIKKLDGFNSVLGQGSRGPNYEQSIFLQNGCKVPVGQIIDYEIKHSTDPSQQVILGHNEYIVYEESQVRIRYMIQLDSTI